MSKIEIIGHHRWTGLHLQTQSSFEMSLLMIGWEHVVTVSKIWVLFASLTFHLLLKLLVDLLGVDLALFHVILDHSGHKLVLLLLEYLRLHNDGSGLSLFQAFHILSSSLGQAESLLWKLARDLTIEDFLGLLVHLVQSVNG